MHSIHWVDPFALSTPIIMGQEDVPVSVSTTLNARYLPSQPEASNPTAIPHENQYMFPHPDIIVTLNMEEKVKSYLVSWLHLRAPLYACLTVTEEVPVNLYHQEWQTALRMGFLHSAGETAFWRGKAYESLTLEEQQEVCWELSEARNATVLKTLITPHTMLHTQTLKFLGGYYVIEAD
ncbi:hypothetical protein EDD85DRAFT_797221 [Armillaria nabsnona]|nr:hypothetical protein EDD85DRAFT_797221 [Armillaria nabsnona]